MYFKYSVILKLLSIGARAKFYHDEESFSYQQKKNYSYLLIYMLHNVCCGKHNMKREESTVSVCFCTVPIIANCPCSTTSLLLP